jgi:acetyltransferase-like isoleucine patch superfamily enzyme
MTITNLPLPPSTAAGRLLDLVSELGGAYRLSALLRGSLVAWSASVKSPSRLLLGRDVVVQQGAILHAGGKAWCRYAGHIRLGDGVRIGPGCVVYGAGGIDLGRHVHLGPGAKLMSQAGRHTPNRETARPDYNFEPIAIGDGTWIGAGAVVLGGATLGRCVTVAPNSVVSGNVPDYAVVVGNPGRVVFLNSGASDD